MKLSELIHQLVELSSDLNPHISLDDIYAGNADFDPEVRIAYQPSYPLAAQLSNVGLVGNDETNQSVLWLAASSTVPYNESPCAPRAAWGE